LCPSQITRKEKKRKEKKRKEKKRKEKTRKEKSSKNSRIACVGPHSFNFSNANTFRIEKGKVYVLRWHSTTQ
jgi:hypothetical protein